MNSTGSDWKRPLAPKRRRDAQFEVRGFGLYIGAIIRLGGLRAGFSASRNDGALWGTSPRRTPQNRAARAPKIVLAAVYGARVGFRGRERAAPVRHTSETPPSQSGDRAFKSDISHRPPARRFSVSGNGGLLFSTHPKRHPQNRGVLAFKASIVPVSAARARQIFGIGV